MHVNFYKDTHCGMVCDIKNKKNKTKMTNNGKIQKKNYTWDSIQPLKIS